MSLARLALVVSLLAAPAQADCPRTLPVAGALKLPTCNPKKQRCVPPQDAFVATSRALKSDPQEFAYVGFGGPWRVYDASMRVLPVNALAALVRKQGKPKVFLATSWSSVKPDKQTPSLVTQLSTALGGAPVRGLDGYAWFSRKGTVRTTRQASTSSADPYLVADGAEVMASAIFLSMLAPSTESGDPLFLVYQGVAWDVIGLCPEKALTFFERAAALGNAAGAWNAAHLLLAQGTPEARTKALALLQQGDETSRELFGQLRATAADGGAP